MAKMVSDVFGNGNSKVVFDIPEKNEYGYAPDTKLFLSSDTYKEKAKNHAIEVLQRF
jgi:hypothetical protein